MKTKRTIAMLLVVAMLFAFVSVIAACEKKPAPTSITVDPSSVSVEVGKSSAKPTLKFQPSDADQSVTWTSADTSVATVNDQGVVTGVKAGETTVTVKSKKADSVQATVTVKVTAQSSEVKRTAITVSPSNVTLDIGAKSSKPTLTFQPSDAVQSVTWTSATPAVATVDDDGVITAVSAGTTTVTATSTVASTVKAEISVTVNAAQDKNKGLTQDNPLTPDEAIALMEEAGSGVVVNASNKDGYYVQGVVNTDSTINNYKEWSFTLGTGEKKVTCQAKVDASVTDKPEEKNGALDGATVIIHGFLELYQGAYKIAYLPASVSPTGDKYTPNLVKVEFAPIPPAEVESISIKNGSVDYSGATAYLLPLEDNSISFTAKVGPDNAPQDIVWTVENGDKATVTTVDGTSETTASASVKYKDQTGSITLTATAKGTDISASVTVEIRDVKGSKQEDPLTVDEAISLMSASEGEYLQADVSHGFYILGTVAAGSTVSASGTWTFALVGSNNKKIECSVEHNKLNDIVIPDMNGGLDNCEVILYAHSIAFVDETFTARGNMNELKSCTFPSLESIVIEAENTEVVVPYSVEIKVKSVAPANAIFDDVVWTSSDQNKATVEGDKTGATLTAVAAGEVKVSVKCGDVTSNEVTITVSEEQQAIKAVYDWTDKFTADTVCNNSYYHYNLPNDTDILDSYINVWTPGQTEITEFKTINAFEAGEEGKGIGYFAHPRRDNSCTISITTQHQISKLTLKLIPYSDATTIQFSVNSQPYQKDKTDSDNWDGKIESAFEVSFDFAEATQNIELLTVWTTGNNFAIVGMTFYY